MIVNKTIIISIILGFSVVLLAFIYVNRDKDEPESGVRIGENLKSNGEDSDGDGSPDWLEELAGTNPDNRKSFPYKKKTSELKKIRVTPSTLNINVDDIDTLTEQEKLRIAEESEEYFRQKLESIQPNEFIVKIDQNANKKIILSKINQVLYTFTSVEEPLSQTLAKILFNQDAGRVILQDSNFICKKTIAILPRTVTPDIAEEYIEFSNRLNSVCYSIDLLVHNDDITHLLNASLNLNALIAFEYDRIEQNILEPLKN